MSIIVALLPIIIMIVLSFLFWAGIKRAGKKLFNNRKTMAGILILYAAVLLISTVAVEAFGPKEQPELTDMKKAEKRIDRFDQLIREGKTEEAGEEWLRKEWIFTLPEDELVLATPIGGMTDDVIVEKTEDEGRDIKVRYYAYAVNGGVEYTGQLAVPELEMEGTRLRLKGASEEVVVNMDMFRNEFPISQFAGNGFSVDVKQTEVIYLQIPRNVKIDNEGALYMEYTGM